MKLSLTASALNRVTLVKGPPDTVPVMPVSGVSDSGKTSEPLEVPDSSGSHLTESDFAFVPSSDALDSAEQVTSSVVTRCAVYLPASKSSGPVHPDSSPLTVIDWIAGVSVKPGERWTVPWFSVQVSTD